MSIISEGEDNMKIWNDEEVLSLFKEVEVCKETKQSLKFAFSCHAEKYKRKPNSVRNYYYHEVDNLKKDQKRCQKLGIDLKLHDKNHFLNFDETEEETLLKKIDECTKQGLSVRSACYKLSNGDLALMTRIQNKYQNLKRKQENNDNIIMFRNRQKVLTESDINSLFMGLVKLIKKTAVEDFMEKTKTEKESSAYLLKRAFVDLGKKDKQIAELRAEFEVLKKENQKLVSKLNEFGQNKNQMLKAHMSKKKMQNAIEN